MNAETFGQRVDRLMAQEFPGMQFDTRERLNLMSSIPCSQVQTVRVDGEPMTIRQRRVCHGISVALIDAFGQAYLDAMYAPRGEWTDVQPLTP